MIKSGWILCFYLLFELSHGFLIRPHRRPTRTEGAVGGFVRNDNDRPITATSSFAASASSQSASVQQKTKKSNNNNNSKASPLRVGRNIGSGSYGTVHTIVVEKTKNDGGEERQLVGKRSWTERELAEKNTQEVDASIDGVKENDKEAHCKERYNRCRYYWDVERHCAETLPPHPGLPFYLGVAESSTQGDDTTSNGSDDEKLTWLLFDKVPASFNENENNGSAATVAPSMQDLLELDLLDHQQETKHRLCNLSSALNITPKEGEKESSSPDAVSHLVKTMDKLIPQTLEILVHVHEHKIVHRDLKPSNLLVADGRIYLIDFGSAADLSTAGLLKANVGLSENRVAISPIYAAPELFVNPSQPTTAVNWRLLEWSLSEVCCQMGHLLLLIR